MKPAPVVVGARQHTDGATRARFKVSLQGETAACRDVLNTLFPSGEIATIIAPSIAFGKQTHGMAGAPFRKVHSLE